MLIRFITSNFLSFNDEIEFSMIPGKSRIHAHHVIKGKGRNDISTLKAAVIYGPNASGKSNLIRAMAFARRLVVKGTRPRKLIPVKPFILDTACADKPSKFEFEFKCTSGYFVYGFEVDRHIVVSEWLYEIKRTTEKMVFERKTTEDNRTEVLFGRVKFKNAKDRQFLEFTARGTRPNQLFLSECVERDVTHFADIYTWFQALTFVFPDTKFGGLEIGFEEENELTKHLLTLLQQFNMGISGIGFEEIDFANDLPELPDTIKENLLADIDEESKVFIRAVDSRYLIHRDEMGEVKAHKLMTKHQMKGGEEETSLDISDESDGTRRLMDLLPALIDMLTNNRVYIVDELDRSLHPTLSYKLLDLFLNNYLSRESQFIVTTHESSLLDLTLLRRDEIWFVEKDKDGASAIYSLEEFTPRYDKDVRKGYLLGRFGAIPMVQTVSALNWVDG